MVSNIGDVIVIIDKNGLNKYKSPNIENLFGWKPEELIGKSTWDNVHPDDLEAGRVFFTAILSEPNAAGAIEVRYKRKDGNYVWIEITVRNLLHDMDIQGILGNYHDITEKKIAAEELRRFKSISDNAIYGNVIADLQGNLIYVNRFFAVIHGYEPDELIGKHFSVFHNEHQIDAAGNLVASMLQEGSFAGDCMALPPGWH
jgi:two-component system, cell cycle sensor histidine kinase and response regulator CckA